jgi:hypothetical protein
MSIELLMEHIYAGFKGSQAAQELAGRALGLEFAQVTNVQDPLNLGRVQVARGSQVNSSTGWLIRVMPWKFLSVPIPAVGDIVLVGFTEGNPNADGFYLGFANNLLNPSEKSGVALTYLWDNLSIVWNQQGILFKLGDLEFLMKAEEFISFKYGLSSVKICKDRIELASPQIIMGTSPETLGNIAAWSSDAINFTASKVNVKNIEVALKGAVDTDGDVIVTTGQ